MDKVLVPSHGVWLWSSLGALVAGNPHVFPPPFFPSFLKLYLFIFGCVGSSLLRVGFLWLWQAGAAPQCCAQEWWPAGSVAPRRVEPVSVFCLGRWTLNRWPAWEVPLSLSSRAQPILPGSPVPHGEASKLWSPSSQTISCLFSFFLFLKWTYSKKDLKNFFFFFAAP